VSISLGSALNADGKRTVKDYTDLVGSGLDALIAVGELFPKTVGKAPIAVLGIASSAIDTFIAISEGIDETKQSDYDAALSKFVAASGAATLTVGSAFVLQAAFTAALHVSATTGASAVATLMTWGGGLSASGVGSPVGAVLLVTGAVLFAGGTIAYYFSNDSEIEGWLKKSPWGNDFEWDFEILAASRDKVDVLNSLIYSFKCQVWHDRLNNRGGVRVTSPFFRHNTKLVIEEMKVIGNGNEEEVICRNLTVDEKYRGPEYAVEVVSKEAIDIVCTVRHKSQLENRKKVFVRLYIDLFGNGDVMLPLRSKPLTKIDSITY
jgi:hypothetical protein